VSVSVSESENMSLSLSVDQLFVENNGPGLYHIDRAFSESPQGVSAVL